MPSQPIRLFLALFLSFATLPAWAQTAAPSGLTPDEARRAIAVLQNDRQRADLVLALKAVANGGAPGNAAPASAAPTDAAPADATPAPAATDGAPATDAATPATDAAAPSESLVPLEANGLVARTLAEVGQWVDGLSGQLGQIKTAVRNLPAWSRASLGSAAGQQLLLKAVLDVLVVFAVALALEWLLHRLLGRPRKTLIDYADAADRRAAHRHPRPVAPPVRTEAPHASDAGLRPSEDNVALMQVSRNGTEQLEAVPVAPQDTAAGATDDTEPATKPAAESAQAAQAADERRQQAKGRQQASEHLSVLRHLPFAVAALILDLLPLVVFFCAAGLLMRWLAGFDANAATITGGFVDAYVTTRVVMAVVRLLMSPLSHGLRLVKASHALARTVTTWVRRFVVLAAFGVAVADAAQVLGAGAGGRLAIVKLVSLVAHLFVVILIFKIRQPIAQTIAAPEGASGALAPARNGLARVWAMLAAVFVMGAWVVWALGVEDGFPKLLHFIGVSCAVIVAGRLVAILLLGGLGRLVHGSGQDGSETSALHGALIERYYPLVRMLLSWLVVVCTVIALCQAWGFNAVGWFAPGTLGRSLLSAVATILVALVIAVVVWQGCNTAIDRRLAAWRDQGDLVRAARLRTLVPMLRTALLVIMVLIVGLTALSQIGINTTPLLAGASIIGVALGFGSQKLVQDFITGIFLLMENAMQVGDWVTVAGVSGTVEYLSIRTVRLRAGDGSLHIVPFSSVSTVNNVNRGLGNAAVRVSVSPDTDVQQVIDELKQLGAGLRADPAFKDMILDDIEVWGVDAVDGSMVTLAGQIRCIDKGRWGVQREMNRRIFERFRELGIAITDPRSRLLVPQDGNWPDPAKTAEPGEPA
jgi:small-conductance mechanosensitive channel